MAGKHRNKRVAGFSDHINLRIPPALKADLQDAALEHGVSMNEEIVRRLMSPQRAYRAGMTRQQWNAMMELEPSLDDQRTDNEIARQMEQIHPYTGELSFTERKTLTDIELLTESLPF